MPLNNALIDVSPLRTSPHFRRWWIGRVCSGLGGQMALVAVLYQVWETTRSPVWTGAAGLASGLPLLVFGLFAGTLADHGDRRRFYLICVAGQTVCAGLLAVQAFAGGLPVGVLLGLVAVQSSFAAGAGPASRAILPRLLPAPELAAGLALNRIAFQASMLLGPALGGLLIASAGVGGCFLADTLSFVVMLGAAATLPPMPPAGEASRPGVRAALAGLRFLAGHRAVRGALLTDLAMTVLAMPVSLFPVLNAERFGGDPRTLGLLFSALAVGGVAASLFSGVFTRRARPAPIMFAAAAVWGAAIALLGVAPLISVALLLLTVAGAADTVAVVTRGTVVQTHTPDAMLGRVSAAELIVGHSGPELGNLRGGLLASVTSATFALVSGGLLGVTAVAVLALRSGRTR
ncbi:putative MFS family arabinose efflux permease [Actinoplanes campanulatus]|uniref:Putative MFS family arabinose efflux permease n=1 Tax=Actinoplanes campanulatus TaxID=113559 RepID=A0A7W5AFD5_9ACTN|nr:MFS transporter [Actinoplanes campanulatus]MBB3095030.1 putative MFS family arabinose efflux permease [Actinoplanes campanulatus]GGN22972.1 MFS transporter [Actinoplanes campanulatus]GID34634.1 MFS transporter [Actinoplanes campanulatus]